MSHQGRWERNKPHRRATVGRPGSSDQTKGDRPARVTRSTRQRARKSSATRSLMILPERSVVDRAFVFRERLAVQDVRPVILTVLSDRSLTFILTFVSSAAATPPTARVVVADACHIHEAVILAVPVRHRASRPNVPAVLNRGEAWIVHVGSDGGIIRAPADAFIGREQIRNKHQD